MPRTRSLLTGSGTPPKPQSVAAVGRLGRHEQQVLVDRHVVLRRRADVLLRQRRLRRVGDVVDVEAVVVALDRVLARERQIGVRRAQRLAGRRRRRDHAHVPGGLPGVPAAGLEADARIRATARVAETIGVTGVGITAGRRRRWRRRSAASAATAAAGGARPQRVGARGGSWRARLAPRPAPRPAWPRACGRRRGRCGGRAAAARRRRRRGGAGGGAVFDELPHAAAPSATASATAADTTGSQSSSWS